MSGTTNQIPPIPIRFEGAENVQRTIDAIVARVGQLEQTGMRASQSFGSLKTQAEQAGTAFRNTGQIIGQAGYQVQDFAVQVASGQSALTAFVQQGSQLAGIFGPTGIMVGAGLAIGGIVAQVLLGRDATKQWNDALKEQEAAFRRVTSEAERWREGLSQEVTQVRQLTDYYNNLSSARRALEVSEVVRQQGRLNDREGTLRRSLEGNAGTLATSLQDQLTQARDYARSQYPSGSAEQRAALDALDNSDAARRLQDLIDTFDRFRASGQLTVDAVAEIVASLRILGRENDVVGRAASDAANRMEQQIPAVRELEGAQRDLNTRAQALGIGMGGIATATDTARQAFERLRDVVLSNPFRGLDSQIAAASERLGALQRGGLALYEGIQGVQGQQERAATLYGNWERDRRAELGRDAGLTSQQISERIASEGPDALMRAMEAARLSANETFRVGQAREAARDAAREARRSRPPDEDLMIGWNAVQDQERDRQAAERQEARDWDQEQERREREQERAHQRLIDANRRTTDNIVDYAANSFATLFDENGKGWQGMLETFESTFKRTLARIAAEAIIRPIVEPIVSGLGLGSLGGGNGGLSGLFGGVSGSSNAAGGGSGGGLLGSMFSSGSSGGGGVFSSIGGYVTNPIWQQGAGWFASSADGTNAALASLGEGVYGPAQQGGGLFGSLGASSIGQYATGIGGGFAVGSTLGSFIAGNSQQRQQNAQYGAAGGAAAGAIIGSIIPGVGTVIGGLVGGAIGGAGGGLFGPSASFKGGDVGVGVDANGFLTITRAGGKNWDGGAARDQTTAQLESLNAILRSSGVTLGGLQGSQLGWQGYGGSKNVFGPTEIWNSVRGNLTSSNPTLNAAFAQPWMQSFEDLSVIAPFSAANDNLTRAVGSGSIRSRDDFNNASTFITQIYEPMVKAASITDTFAESLNNLAKQWGDAIGKATELGLATDTLVAAQRKAVDTAVAQRNTAVHEALTSLRIDELRATGSATDARQADQIAFSLRTAQELRQTQSFLTQNGYGEGTDLYAQTTARLMALFDTQRRQMNQPAEEAAGVNSGTALLQDLLVGDAGGLSLQARYAAGVSTLGNLRRSGDLDAYTSFASRFLGTARSYLGTSERFGQFVGRVRNDTVALGGDPTGMLVDVQTRTADATEGSLRALNLQTEEIKALRSEIAKFASQVATLQARQTKAA